MKTAWYITMVLVMVLAAAVAPAAYADECEPEVADSVAVIVEVAKPDTTIMGRAEMSIDRMYYFVKSRNENFSYDVAEAFYSIGERYGIRGDIALCQAVLETGWFRFMDGTEVTPDQYNFGGLGVKCLGEKGCAFASMEEGVTALIQHLYAYACAEELPRGERLVDERFRLVSRGCAPTWQALSGRWAMNENYGNDIMRIFGLMETFELPELPEEYYQ